jgi:hypothetical protein
LVLEKGLLGMICGQKLYGRCEIPFVLYSKALDLHRDLALSHPSRAP